MDDTDDDGFTLTSKRKRSSPGASREAKKSRSCEEADEEEVIENIFRYLGLRIRPTRIEHVILYTSIKTIKQPFC